MIPTGSQPVPTALVHRTGLDSKPVDLQGFSPVLQLGTGGVGGVAFLLRTGRECRNLRFAGFSTGSEISEPVRNRCRRVGPVPGLPYGGWSPPRNRCPLPSGSAPAKNACLGAVPGPRLGAVTRPVRRIGFYGCSLSGKGKLVRLELGQHVGWRSYPEHITLQCPACGHTHEARPLWRKYFPKLDDGKEAFIL